MKLKFESNLAYQNDAVAAVVDLFGGQQESINHFTVDRYEVVGQEQVDVGVANRLQLSQEQLQKNLDAVQARNQVPMSSIREQGYNFDIEMETGTGKTYVYLKSIMELHQKYGFLKFVIVVPSLAIKEGVSKSLEITKEHFKELYSNIAYKYFVYDSNKLSEVRDFAMATTLSIMVINIDAFRRSFTDPSKATKANIIHRQNDRLNGTRPIELIQQTSPILIIDEPQSVDSTDKAREAIRGLNPLVTFRYSATHREKYNTLYKLDAVDAFSLGLVKQIQVMSFSSMNYHNNAYMRLVSLTNKPSIQAKIEIDIDMQGSSGAINRSVLTVKAGDDLYELSGRRDAYKDYMVEEINVGEGYVSFTNEELPLRVGAVRGDVDDRVIKEAQIRATIEEHLQNQKRLKPKGIKVLSLFFIDRVSNYRYYDEEGNACKGPYAELFERLYQEVAASDKYRDLFEGKDHEEVKELAESVHNGYFAQDPKGRLKDTKGASQADDDAYALIMRDKERLLSFDGRLEFIFSHSALKEGWDNPNVFQICTLNETQSEIKKRQEIGRGLRLCVNKEGEREKEPNLNILTVMANESYEDFCDKLQTEYSEESGIKFGSIGLHQLAYLTAPITDYNSEPITLGKEGAMEICESFVKQEYLKPLKGKANKGFYEVTEKFATAVAENKVEVPEEYQIFKENIVQAVSERAAKLPVKNARKRKAVRYQKERALSPEFKALWDKIKYKTTYRVDFDTEELINKCATRLEEEVRVARPKLLQTKVGVEIREPGVQANLKSEVLREVTSDYQYIPDPIAYLQNRTNLKRSTLAAILVGSGKVGDFVDNPQQFLEQAQEHISSVMRQMLVDGIKYEQIGEEAYYTQTMFEEQELIEAFEDNMIATEKSIYDHVVYDSLVEKSFAEHFELNEAVKLFVKLPDWFKVPTPLGSYNPDWALVVEEEDEKKLYLVVESKGNIMAESLRSTELSKIKCGEKHFEALNTGVVFRKSDDPMQLF